MVGVGNVNNITIRRIKKILFIYIYLLAMMLNFRSSNNELVQRKNTAQKEPVLESFDDGLDKV